jgi:hypothetical protein
VCCLQFPYNFYVFYLLIFLLIIIIIRLDIWLNLRFRSLVGWVNSQIEGLICNQCFETRPGPTGRPGTWPTRVCGRVGSKQKTCWELAWWDPADPRPGRPETRPTRAHPAETRVFLIYIVMTETISFSTFTIKRPNSKTRRAEERTQCRRPNWFQT